MGFSPGDILRDRYQIIKELGKGGWGVTYLAEDTQLPTNPYCVVKEITPAKNLSLEYSRIRFEEEAKALYSLGNHSQIPQLFAYFEQDRKFYLIQDYIEGQNLQEKFNSGCIFTQEEVIAFLLDILDILKFVHQQSKIHRDIKPSNLIVREKDKKIVLIDFGAVKEIYGLEYTKTGEIQSTVAIGTLGYMPPEQHCCNPQYNSDIYALGVVSIRAITGLYPPISSENNPKNLNSMQINSSTGEIIWKDLQQSTNRLNLDSRLEAILNKMICYNFCDRYQSVSEVIVDLQKFNPNKRLNSRDLLQQQITTAELVTDDRITQSTTKPKSIAIGILGLIVGALLMKFLPALLLAPNSQDYVIDFEEVCNSSIIKGSSFHKHQGTPRYIKQLNSTPVWSVFGWKCVFSDEQDIQLRGINLNDYCIETYRKSGYYYEAYFKNFLDKNSWYCTNVGTKLEPLESE